MQVNQELISQAWKQVTWGNTLETAEDWVKALIIDDKKVKQHIFNLLFREAPEASILRGVFSEDELSSYLYVMDKKLARSHLEKRRKVLRYLYCGIRESIPELDWIVAS